MTYIKFSTELQEMAALAEWVALHEAKIPELKRLFHIPNEGPRNRFKVKNLLIRPGVSDYFLAVPKYDYAGLWIELKAPGWKPTNTASLKHLENQQRWLSTSREYGYMAALCYGWQEAVEEIEGYLGMR